MQTRKSFASSKRFSRKPASVPGRLLSKGASRTTKFEVASHSFELQPLNDLLRDEAVFQFFPPCSYSPFFICFECFREFSVADCTSFQFHEAAALRLLRADDARHVVSFEVYESCGRCTSPFLPGAPKSPS